MRRQTMMMIMMKNDGCLKWAHGGKGRVKAKAKAKTARGGAVASNSFAIIAKE